MTTLDDVAARFDTFNSTIEQQFDRQHGTITSLANRLAALELGGAAVGAGAQDDPEAEVRTSLGREEKMTDWARKAGYEAPKGLHLGGFIRSMVCGPKNDIERKALAEGTDSAGGYTVPDLLAARLIDLMRSKLVCVRAGAQTVPLASDVNFVSKQLTDPVPAWRAENAAVAESEPTFGRIELRPKSLAVMFRCSRELLEDSVNLNTQLPNIIASAMALELDRVCMFGSGSSNQPLGIVNTSGINSIALNAALSNYSPFVRARTAIQTANIDGPSAFILHPRTEGALAELVDSTGQPLEAPEAVASIPMLATTAVPVNGGTDTNESSIMAGQFQHLLLGLRTGIRVEILRERYADTLQYGFLAHLRADVAVEYAKAFTLISGVHPAT